MTFKETFKVIYEWQSKLYESEQKNPVPKTVPYYFADSDSDNEDILSVNDKYTVLKWKHNGCKNMMLLSIDEDKSYVPCTMDHINELLTIIDEMSIYGCSLKEIKEKLYESDNNLHTEIVLNIEKILTRLVKLEIVGAEEDEFTLF